MFLKLLLKIFSLIVGIILFLSFLLIAIILIFNLKGADILSEILSKKFNSQVTISSAQLSYNNLKLQNITSPIISIKEIQLTFSLYPLCLEELTISKPTITTTNTQLKSILEHLKDIRNNLASSSKPSKDKPHPLASKKISLKNFHSISGQYLPLMLTKLTIKNGLLKIKAKDYCYRISDLNFSSYHPDKTLFWTVDLRANIISPKYQGNLTTKGWIDLAKKNAKFTITANNIDIDIIETLAKIVPMDGKLSLKIKGEAKNDKLTIQTHLKLEEFCYKPLKLFQDLPVARELIPGVNKVTKKRIETSFSVTTSLTHPNIKIARIIKNAIIKQRDNKKDDKENLHDKKDIYDIINDFAGAVGNLIENLTD